MRYRRIKGVRPKKEKKVTLRRDIYRDKSTHFRHPPYANVVVYLSAEERNAIKKAAKEAGMSMSTYIKIAVDEKMGIEVVEE